MQQSVSNDSKTSQVCVSVIMPNYNCAKFLSKSIESVLNQTYTNFELIIVDDASTDNSLSVANEYANDNRVKIISANTNGGAAKTRN